MPSDFASVRVWFVHGLGHASLMPSDMGRRGLDLGSGHAWVCQEVFVSHGSFR